MPCDKGDLQAGRAGSAGFSLAQSQRQIVICSCQDRGEVPGWGLRPAVLLSKAQRTPQTRTSEREPVLLSKTQRPPLKRRTRNCAALKAQRPPPTHHTPKQNCSAEYASETDIRFARALGAKGVGGDRSLTERVRPSRAARHSSARCAFRAHFLRRARFFGFATLAAFFAAGLRADLERFLAMFSILFPFDGA